MIELKTTFGNFTNSEHQCTGLYIFRVVTAIPMASDVAKKAVIDKILAEVEGAHSQGVINDMNTETAVNAWSKLKESKKLLFKEDKFNHEDKDYYFYQMAVQINPEDMGYHSSRGIFEDIMRSIYRGWNMGDDRAYTRMPDVIYQVVEIGSNANKIILSSDNSFNDYALNNIMTPEHNIVLSTHVDTTKTYNRNSIMKVKYEFHMSMIDAFNHKDGTTSVINDYGMMFPALRFTQVRNHQSGSYSFHLDYKTNPHLEFVNGVAVFWDGKKSRDCVMPHIPALAQAGIKMVNILQFSGSKDFFYGDMRTNLVSRKVIYHFMNRERVYTSYCDLRVHNGKVNGRVLCLPVNGKKKKMYNIAVQNGNGYVGEFIIPVDDKNSQEKAVACSIELLTRRIRGLDIDEQFNHYRTILFDAITQDEDILSQWFSYCTRNMRNTDDSIVRTYMNMKTTLEREYKEIGTYLGCYDFSKCQPIPRVTSDKKLLENYYKSLQIEPKNIIIKSINNKRIKPISEIQPTVRFMVPDKKVYITHETPLSKYYNGKTNEIELSYIKMKGEVTHAKAKNWR